MLTPSAFGIPWGVPELGRHPDFAGIACGGRKVLLLIWTRTLLFLPLSSHVEVGFGSYQRDRGFPFTRGTDVAVPYLLNAQNRGDFLRCLVVFVD